MTFFTQILLQCVLWCLIRAGDSVWAGKARGNGSEIHFPSEETMSAFTYFHKSCKITVF